MPELQVPEKPLLETIAEQLSRAGIAVLLSDVKGDLSGLAQAGLNNDSVVKRFVALKIPLPDAKGSPVEFWDIYGESGHPLRTTLSAMGPLLLGRLLDANPIQQGIVDAAFSLADDRGLLLLDLKDFRAYRLDVRHAAD